jgi:prolyl-tRNA synthetase
MRCPLCPYDSTPKGRQVQKNSTMQTLKTQPFAKSLVFQYDVPMRQSHLFTKTRKEAPSDEVSKNAQLLIRAGFIHKEMAGVYAFLPLGLRVIEKIKNIVREEMNAVGGQEVVMTALQPRDIWEKTDRWDDAKVDNWFKTKLKNGTELGVGLTHEEPIVDVIKDYVSSYRDLPFSVYQMQTKFRNETRAKSGILRGREFLMKDMYSFSRNQEEHTEVYEKVAAAYHRVYQRLGIGDITYRVKADGGIFTERYSDEFQTLTSIGEDTLFKVPDTDIYFNQEVAPSQAVALKQDNSELKPMEEVFGENIVGVEDLAKFLGVAPESTTKTMIYTTETDDIVAVAVRGDYQINEIKLRKVLGVKKVTLADESVVQKITGSIVGYAGLIGLSPKVKIIVDDSCKDRTNFEMGANKSNYHNINVNWGRDVATPEQFYDIKLAKQGDIHPETGKPYELHNAVEVGNIFPLESKYTDALEVFYIDENKEKQSIVGGCYGIGISRTMGVIAEIFSDDKGIIWPESIAPFRVHLLKLGESTEVSEKAEALYASLQKAGVEVLFDDRVDFRPGEKFADADLIGIPERIVVSEKSLSAGGFEIKKRNETEAKIISETEALALFK